MTRNLSPVWLIGILAATAGCGRGVPTGAGPVSTGAHQPAAPAPYRISVGPGMGDGTTSQPPSTTSSGTTVIIGGRRVYIPSGVIHVGGRTVRLRGPAEGSNASEVLWGYTYLMEDLAEREAARAQRLRQVANLRAQAAQLRSQAANPSLSQNQRDMLIAQAGFYEAQARSLIY